MLGCVQSREFSTVGPAQSGRDYPGSHGLGLFRFVEQRGDRDSSGEVENEIGRDVHRYKISFGKMETVCSYGDWFHSLGKILKTTWAYSNNEFSVT